MGLCSGAVSSFRTARVDSRVAGAVLLDPWGYSAESSSLATTRLYWQSVWSVVALTWALDGLDPAPPGRSSHTAPICGARWSAGSRTVPVEAEFRAVLERGVELLVLFSSPYDRARHEFDLVVGDRLKQWSGVRPRDVRGLPRRDATRFARWPIKPPSSTSSIDGSSDSGDADGTCRDSGRGGRAGVTPLALPLPPLVLGLPSSAEPRACAARRGRECR